MASDDARVQNNKDFQLNELFNVKNKVALITGNHLKFTALKPELTEVKAVAPALD